MTSNIIVKINRAELESIRRGERKTVTLPMNQHWNRKLKNPGTGRYYQNLRVIVRSFEKEPAFVLTAKAGMITPDGNYHTITLKEIQVLLPPFNHQLINEPRRNSIR